MCQSFFTRVCVDKEGGKGRFLCARKIFLSYNNRTYILLLLSFLYTIIFTIIFENDQKCSS